MPSLANTWLPTDIVSAHSPLPAARMTGNGDQVNAEPLSDNDRCGVLQQRVPSIVLTSFRLIAALKMCFRDLENKHDEQFKSQQEQAERYSIHLKSMALLTSVRLQKAVEALKPPVPIPDKKTAFWNSYMKLADEHDEEFKQKYSSDLDTALIFVRGPELSRRNYL
jgi:hypothetical protein